MKADWEKHHAQAVWGDKWPQGVVSVLDVGCGISLKSRYMDATLRVGLDPFMVYLERVETSKPWVPLNCSWEFMPFLFPPNSFDVVLLACVLENLTKEDGRALLVASERIARKAVAVETPEGIVPQDRDPWGLGGDYWQTHRSRWGVEDFYPRGYAVALRPYVLSGVKRHETEPAPEKIMMIDALWRKP